MSKVQVSDITVKYHIFANKRKNIAEQDVFALKGACVTFESGEFVAITGPSGCGKTTLLRVIAGLTPQDSGKIFIDGKCVDEMGPNQRNVGMVFQEFSLYPHMTAFENMAYPLIRAKMPMKEIKEYVYQVAELLDITYLLNRKPKHMSWGQRQRVALGRSVCRKPDIMLLDEPLSGADQELRDELKEVIRALHSTYGFTCLYVTHKQDEAAELADRIIVMENGAVVRDMTAEEYRKELSRDTSEAESKVYFEYTGGQSWFDEEGHLVIPDTEEDDG